jgi:hypothetical protein
MCNIRGLRLTELFNTEQLVSGSKLELVGPDDVSRQTPFLKIGGFRRAWVGWWESRVNEKSGQK